MSQFFVLLQRILPQHLLSRLVGLVANSQVRFVRLAFIRTIVRVYNVDLAEAQRSSVEDYASFNDFFTRALAAGAREISGALSSPADGTVSQLGNIRDGQLIQAKGTTYSLEKLLGESCGEHFANGSFVTIYLAPRDYHRVHVPVEGDLHRTRYIPGKLFSVNDVTTRQVRDLFAINERLVTFFERPEGPYALIMVGAMIVAGIRTTWRERTYQARTLQTESFVSPKHFAQGDELGHFEMGSTAILVFEQQVSWSVAAGDTVRMGQSLGDFETAATDDEH